MRLDRIRRRPRPGAGRPERGERPPGAPAPLRAVVSSRPGRLLVGTVAAVALLTLVGLVLLWPSGDRPTIAGGKVSTVGGEVTDVRTAPCGPGSRQRCETALVRLTDGPHEGQEVEVVLGPTEVSPDLDEGQSVRLADQSAPAGGDAGPSGSTDDTGTGSPQVGDRVGSDVGAGDAAGEPSYAFSGVDRRTPIIALALLFGLLGAVVARGRGLLALLGTGISLSLVVLWLVPAILDGGSPILVATVGALAVMFVTTGLTYGITAQSLAAVTGIGLSLLVAALLGTLWTDLAGLDGKDGDLGAFTIQSGGTLPLQGILLAGMVIGALGVLTDTVVSQVSTVAALHWPDPDFRSTACESRWMEPA